MTIELHILGAGSMVGRSCFVVSIDGVSVLIDAGVHMNPSTKEERLPLIPKNIQLQAAFISHYHLDHIGALPYLVIVLDVHDANSQCVTCDIYMSEPTRALGPLLLVDYCKGSVNSDLYYPCHVHSTFSSVKTFGLHEQIGLPNHPTFTVTPIYAGHVLGGVMFLMQYNGQSVLYTGDYSVMGDSLLREAQIPTAMLPPCGVDVVISEATHATGISSAKKMLENEILMCEKIHRAIQRGGSVLIPVFAVGRLQELAIIIKKYFASNASTEPMMPSMYTTSVAGKRASVLVSTLLSQWTNKGRGDVCQFDPSGTSAIDNLDINFLSDSDSIPHRSIIFASPAMLEGGSSLRLFIDMCTDSRNLVLLTGFCSPETVGNSVILFASRKVSDKRIFIHGKPVNVMCECAYVPFSNHTDSLGLEQIIRKARPREAVVLVHGERKKMEAFRDNVLHKALPRVRIEVPCNGDILLFAREQEERTCNGGGMEDNRVLCSIDRSIVNSGNMTMASLKEKLKELMPTVNVVEEESSKADSSHLIVTDSVRGYSVELSPETRDSSGVATKFNCHWQIPVGVCNTPEWALHNPVFHMLRSVVENQMYL